MIIFQIDNQEEIPEDLPDGMYTTKVLGSNVSDHDVIIHLKFIGEKCDLEHRRCMFPFKKTIDGENE